MGGDTATLVVPTFLDGRRIWVIMGVGAKDNFSSYAWFLWYMEDYHQGDFSWGEKTGRETLLDDVEDLEEFSDLVAWTDTEEDVAVLAKSMEDFFREMRLDGDEGPFTYDEFIEFYGEELGGAAWEEGRTAVEGGSEYGIVAHPGYPGDRGLALDLGARGRGRVRLLLTAEQRELVASAPGWGAGSRSVHDVKTDDWGSRWFWWFCAPFEQRLVDADGSALALRQMRARAAWVGRRGHLGGYDGWVGSSMPTIFWSRRVHRAVVAKCLGVDVSVGAFIVHLFMICSRVELDSGSLDHLPGEMVEMIVSFLMEVRVGHEGGLVQQQQAIEYGEGGGGDAGGGGGGDGGGEAVARM